MQHPILWSLTARQLAIIKQLRAEPKLLDEINMTHLRQLSSLLDRGLVVECSEYAGMYRLTSDGVRLASSLSS